MPILEKTDTKDRFTRQVARVYQSNNDGEIFSYHRVYLYALDGSRIGFCDMSNNDIEIEYLE